MQRTRNSIEMENKWEKSQWKSFSELLIRYPFQLIKKNEKEKTHKNKIWFTEVGNGIKTTTAQYIESENRAFFSNNLTKQKQNKNIDQTCCVEWKWCLYTAHVHHSTNKGAEFIPRETENDIFLVLTQDTIFTLALFFSFSFVNTEIEFTHFFGWTFFQCNG